MPEPEDVRDIVKIYLTEHNYDGLYDDDGECACLLDDLMPCDQETALDCIPGHTTPCPGGENCQFDPDGDHYHMEAGRRPIGGPAGSNPGTPASSLPG